MTAMRVLAGQGELAMPMHCCMNGLHVHAHATTALPFHSQLGHSEPLE